YRDLGDVEFTSGTLPAAVNAYEKGRQIAESIGDHAGVAAAQTMLSNALARAGDIDDAVRHGEMAVKLGEQIGDERRIAWANIMLAQCYTCKVGRCDPVKVQNYSSEAQLFFAKIGDYRGLSWVLSWKADIAFVNNNFDLAITAVREHNTRAASS